MEPEKIGQQGQSPSTNQPNDDLHAEGIDLMGSGVSDENEFSGTPSSESVDSEPTPAEADTKAPEEVIKPKPEAPKEMPVVAKQIFNAQAPVPKPAPVATPKPAPEGPRNDASIKPIRTFKSDAEEAVKYGGVSKIGIAVAEQNKREASGAINYGSETKSRPAILISIIFVLIFIGLGGGWYYYKYFLSTPTPVDTPIVKINTIIPYAKASLVVLNDTATPLNLIENKIAKSDTTLGTVFAVLPVISATSTTQAPVSRIFAGTRIPDRLSRSLGNDYMFGMYMFEVQSPFVIIKNTFYQNAYSGMLEWEKDLKNDFARFIQQSYPDADMAYLDRISWIDTLVSNIDVRSIKDASGKTVLAYAFADKDTIVLATSDTALKYLIDTLLQVRTIQ